MFRSAKTPAQRRRLIERWRASGMPLTRFARVHHIHPRTFWGWVREAPKTVSTVPTFLPVQVVAGPHEPDKDAQPSDASAIAEIVLPSGPRVRVAVGVSPSWVAALIKGLQTAC